MDQFSQISFILFLPLQILSQLLLRIKVEGTLVILIAPSWLRRTWYIIKLLCLSGTVGPPVPKASILFFFLTTVINSMTCLA